MGGCVRAPQLSRGVRQGSERLRVMTGGSAPMASVMEVEIVSVLRL